MNKHIFRVWRPRVKKNRYWSQRVLNDLFLPSHDARLGFYFFIRFISFSVCLFFQTCRPSISNARTWLDESSILHAKREVRRWVGKLPSRPKSFSSPPNTKWWSAQLTDTPVPKTWDSLSRNILPEFVSSKYERLFTHARAQNDNDFFFFFETSSRWNWMPGWPLNAYRRRVLRFRGSTCSVAARSTPSELSLPVVLMSSHTFSKLSSCGNMKLRFEIFTKLSLSFYRHSSGLLDRCSAL